MGRTRGLLLGALIFALAAAGAMVWAGVIEIPGQPAGTPNARAPAVATPPSPSPEIQLVKVMNDVAAAGGFVATFQERDLRKWQIADGHRLERFSLSDSAFARLTSTTVLDKASVAWPTWGLSAKLPVEFAQAANGKRIQVGLVVRSAQTNGSPEVSVVFATQQAGNTGWRSFQLKHEFELLKFVYDVPPVESGYTATPIVVVHSDATGGGKAVELIGLYVKILR